MTKKNKAENIEKTSTGQMFPSRILCIPVPSIAMRRKDPSNRWDTITLFSSGLQKISFLFSQDEHGALKSNVQRYPLFFTINKKEKRHEYKKTDDSKISFCIRTTGDILK